MPYYLLIDTQPQYLLEMMPTKLKVSLLLVVAAIQLVTKLAQCTEPELEIHNTFKPEQCKRKAKVTDILTLHYKGTLQNGQVFDSR